MRKGLNVALALAGAAFGCYAQNRPEISGVSDEEFYRFFRSLQAAVSSSKSHEVADLVEFPVSVHLASGKRATYTRASFLKEYESIVTPCVKQVVQQQDPAAIFTNSYGWMFGIGAVWASGICRDKSCQVVALRVTSFSPYAAALRPNPSVKGTSCAEAQAAPYLER